MKGLISKIFDVGVVVLEEFVQSGAEATLDDGGIGVLCEGVEGLGDVEADVGDRIAGHLDDNGQDSVGDVCRTNNRGKALC